MCAFILQNYTKILEVNLFAFANANKLASRIFVYKSSPTSTLRLVIPEYIWIVLLQYYFKFYSLYILHSCYWNSLE